MNGNDALSNNFVLGIACLILFRASDFFDSLPRCEMGESFRRGARRFSRDNIPCVIANDCLV